MNRAAVLLGVLLRDQARHPLQVAASIAGIALGLAVVVAIHSAGAAARESFTRTFEAFAGRATHQVHGTGGVSPEAVGRLLAHPEVVAVQPVIQGVVTVVGLEVDEESRFGGSAAEPLELLGLDPLMVAPFLPDVSAAPDVAGTDAAALLTVPNGVLVPGAWAREHGIAAGETFDVVAAGLVRPMTVLGLLPEDLFAEATRDLALVDLATADELLARGGRLDRLDVIADAETDLSSVLAPNERAERPATRGERSGRLVDAFRLNLLALSTLALLVGCYLVFNAAQFTVVRRAALLGQLRCLGAPRGALLFAVLGELALQGLVGGLAGLAGGWGLARLLVGDVERTVSTLYGFVRVDSVAVRPGLAVAYVAVAVLVALAAGWLPARDAARTEPRLVGFRAAAERRFARTARRLVLLSGAAALVAAAALALPTDAPWPGFVAAFAILVAAGAAVPPLLALLLPRLRRAADRFGRTGFSLAAGEVERSLSRTGAATGALAVSLAMALGVIVMVHSFEREVLQWLDDAVRADLFLSPYGQEQSPEDARLPDGAVTILRSLPDAASVELLRGRDAILDGRLIRVLGVEGRSPDAIAARTFMEGDPGDAVRALADGATLVSEPLANHHDLHLGDRLTLRGRNGPVSFEIAGVFRDYALDRGYALLDAAAYLEAFGDRGVMNAAITLRPGVDPAAAADDLRRRLREGPPPAPYLVDVVASGTLRKQVQLAFGETFAVTYVLELLATGLALLGIAATLVSLFLERLRELATLRAVGASLRYVGGLFVAQGLLVAGTAALAALPVGAVLAWLLTGVVNLRSFGWTIRLAWPWTDVLATCGLALLAGLLASLAPLLLARRAGIAEALREE